MDSHLPDRGQILLPLLDVLDGMGGSGEPNEVIPKVAERLGVPKDVQEFSGEKSWVKWGKRTRYPWRQSVHWVRQEAATRGLIDRSEKGVWRLTDQGRDALHNCQTGVVLRVFETPSGEYLWADAVTAAGHLQDNSVNLLFTSPPYPLAGAGRKYGNLSEAETIGMIMRCAPDWRRALTEDGSLVLNLKDCWAGNGLPVRSLYIERLLLALVDDAKFFFADRHIWRNPACAPTTPFVTVQKVRCSSELEQVLWLSKTGRPKADTTRVMEPAKTSTIETYLRKARRGQLVRTCESGQKNIFEEQVARVAAGEKIMVLPRNIQTFANSDCLRTWKAKLADAGLPAHPARMPLALARWWISFLTDVGDTVLDPFGGSGTTALAAEELGRRWITSDRALAYALGAALRFETVSFEPWLMAA